MSDSEKVLKIADLIIHGTVNIVSNTHYQIMEKVALKIYNMFDLTLNSAWNRHVEFLIFVEKNKKAFQLFGVSIDGDSGDPNTFITYNDKVIYYYRSDGEMADKNRKFFL